MLKVMEIGNPILRKKAKAVTKIDKPLLELLDKMTYTMRNHRIKGCGLAAPQVGHSLRVAVIEPEPNQCFYIINPEIIFRSGKESMEEGCLSIPGTYGKVERATRIQYYSLDIKTKKKTLYEAKGFTARIIQHETDHLNGTLFTDYIHSGSELEFSKNEKIPVPILEKYGISL